MDCGERVLREAGYECLATAEKFETVDGLFTTHQKTAHKMHTSPGVVASVKAYNFQELTMLVPFNLAGYVGFQDGLVTTRGQSCKINVKRTVLPDVAMYQANTFRRSNMLRTRTQSLQSTVKFILKTTAP